MFNILASTIEQIKPTRLTCQKCFLFYYFNSLKAAIIEMNVFYVHFDL